MDIENEAKQSAKALETLFSVNGTMNEPSEEESLKNPLLLGPVIRCVLKYLKIKDVKKCRLVSQEWASNGEMALASRALIHIHNNNHLKPFRRPADFQSCFLDSTTLFSAFKISGHLINPSKIEIEEFTKFFDNQQKYIKELTLKFNYSEEQLEKNIDISSWISKSLIVQKDVKNTKLSIKGYGRMLDIPSLHLLENINVLTLSDCRINIQKGIRIFPMKLKLANATIFQDGIKLNRFRVNDIVDVCKLKEISLNCADFEDFKDYETKYVLDFSGSATLDILTLKGVEIVNGETSQWVIENLSITEIPYSLHSQMKIQELTLSDVGTIDLFLLPDSIQRLTIDMESDDTPVVTCSQPIKFPNLQYLRLYDGGRGAAAYSFSFLSHFMDCPQLTFLKFIKCLHMEMNSLWMPKNIKTLSLYNCLINWLDDTNLKLEKLVLQEIKCAYAKSLCEAKIQVDDVYMLYRGGSASILQDRELPDFLEHRNRFNFGKRFYVGEFWWFTKFENSALKDHVDIKSSFYAFDNGPKGRAISKQDFYMRLCQNINPKAV